MGQNDYIKAMLGTAPAGRQAGTQKMSNPALKQISTNGALLIQNVSKLSETLRNITRNWGA